MLFKIKNNKLINGENIIDLDVLYILTGRIINLNIRNNGAINIIRDRGRIKLYETKLYPSCTYKRNNITYVCTYIDENGHGILKQNNDSLNIIYAKTIHDWEIIS